MFEVLYWIFGALFVFATMWYALIAISHLRYLKKEEAQKTAG